MKTLRVLILFVIVAALSVPVNAADISLQKGVSPANPNIYHKGETIHYVMRVTNVAATETITINSVTDTLPNGNVVNLTPPAVPYNLGPGAFQDYAYDWVVPNDTNAGIIVNTLRVTGVQLSTVPDPFDAQVQKSSLIVVPCIDVNKTADPVVSKAGDKVIYTVRICNCGTNALKLVDVNDSLLGVLTSYYPATLAIGECNTQKFEYTVQQSDPDPLVNTVVVNAIDDTNYPVSDNDNASVDLVHPCLQATKSCQNEPIPPGGSAIFRITITNCGDVALHVATDENDIPPFVLGAGQSSQQDVSITAGPNDTNVFNTVSVWATLPPALGLDNVIGPVEANDTCRVGQEGATRTLGFWKTHCVYTEHVLKVHCGGSLNLGWVVLNDINDVIGALYSNPAKNTDDSKRDQLCKARILTTHQAVAALLNSCLDNGSPLPVLPGEIASILAGTDVQAIHQLGGILDDYNNSGDDVTIIDGDGYIFGNATPKACKAIANLAKVDCISTINQQTSYGRKRR